MFEPIFKHTKCPDLYTLFKSYLSSNLFFTYCLPLVRLLKGKSKQPFVCRDNEQVHRLQVARDIHLNIQSHVS